MGGAKNKKAEEKEKGISCKFTFLDSVQKKQNHASACLLPQIIAAQAAIAALQTLYEEEEEEEDSERQKEGEGAAGRRRIRRRRRRRIENG